MQTNATNNDLFGDLFDSGSGQDGKEVDDLFPDFNSPATQEDFSGDIIQETQATSKVNNDTNRKEDAQFLPSLKTWVSLGYYYDEQGKETEQAENPQRR